MMTKLRKIKTEESSRLEGFLAAAQQVFFTNYLDVGLEATLLEIIDRNHSAEDVVEAAYGDCFNPIEYRNECSLDQMLRGAEEILSVSKTFWNPEFSVRDRLERDLREGYWQHVKLCLDYENARIIELGYHIPYVNMGGGFTYIIYAEDMSCCLLLVGNISD